MQDKSWYFDPATERTAALTNYPQADYLLLDATPRDVQKTIGLYQRYPVPGYEVSSVQVIYNRDFNVTFQAYLKQQQLKKDNPVFAPTWSTMSNPALRHKTNALLKSISQPYTDCDFPDVALIPAWHGTRPEILDSIFKIGYSNLALTDSGFFGKGLYSAYEAEYSYRVYSKGALILNWVACFSTLPVVDGDMPLLIGKGNHGSYDAHFVPVVPQDPNNPNEKNYFPWGTGQIPKYHEIVVFQTAACLPRFLVTLQPTLPKPISTLQNFKEVSHGFNTQKPNELPFTTEPKSVISISSSKKDKSIQLNPPIQLQKYILDKNKLETKKQPSTKTPLISPSESDLKFFEESLPAWSGLNIQHDGDNENTYFANEVGSSDEYKNLKRCVYVASGFAGSIVIGTVLYYVFASKKPCQPNDMTVTHDTEFSGTYNRTLLLYNNGQELLEAFEVNFMSNIKIIFEQLPLNTTLTRKQQADGNYLYTLVSSDANSLRLLPNKPLKQNYYFVPPTDGNLASTIGLNPSNVSITLQNRTVINIAVHGTDNCAQDPLAPLQFYSWYRYWDENPNWMDAEFNHQNLMFSINVNETGQVNSGLYVNQNNNMFNYIQDAQKNLNLRVLWSLPGYCKDVPGVIPFERLIANDALLRNFSKSVALNIRKMNISGVTIDWEWWGDGCQVNAIDVEKLVSALSDVGIEEISMAIPIGQDKISLLPDEAWSRISSKVDSFQLIPYDRSSSSYSHFMTRLNLPNQFDPDKNNTVTGSYSIEQAYHTYHQINHEITQKTSVVIPVFGRGNYVADMNDPYGMGYGRKIIGDMPGQEGPGVYNYKCIVENDCNGDSGLPNGTKLVSSTENSYGNMPLAYNRANNSMVSYVDAFAAEQITAFVKKNNMAGVSIASSNQDTNYNSNTSITRAAKEALLSNTDKKRIITSEDTNMAEYALSQLESLFDGYPELLAHCKDAAKNGLIVGFLMGLVNESSDYLSKYLKVHGYSDGQIHFVKSVIEMLLVTMTSAIPGTLAYQVSHHAMTYCGVSEETSQKISAGIAVGVNTFGVVANATTIATMSVGMLAAKTGMFAAKQVFDYVTHPEQKDDIEQNRVLSQTLR